MTPEQTEEMKKQEEAFQKIMLDWMQEFEGLSPQTLPKVPNEPEFDCGMSVNLIFPTTNLING